jgi:methylthioribose-1-phosphate isomerase
MRVAGKAYRTIWPAGDGRTVRVIDQRRLPHEFRVAELATCREAAAAIREMWVRGAPLIGATAAYGVALAMAADPSDAGLDAAAAELAATRPTAVNLAWALDAMRACVAPLRPGERAAAAFARAAAICDDDVAINRAIGANGLEVLRGLSAAKRGAPLNVLTHCNAGWLATVDHGTATAPIYAAAEEGMALHVWVDETRPRNQGAMLTAWELANEAVPHTLVADNAGGHLMQRGLVDLVLVGTDRVTARGDVANKIGTYLKALAAKDNGVPFFVALPSPTIDWSVRDGLAEIPIEERDAGEVTHVWGRRGDGGVEAVRIAPEATAAANPAFDVTPARLVAGLVTERGVCAASAEGLAGLFPERRAA